jgi:transcriptional regulator
LVVPTHFTATDEELLFHLARPNPVWPHLEAAAEVRMTVIGDYAYIPGYWRTRPGVPDEEGVPTSYYSAVQFLCRPTVVDDPEGKSEIISAQLADLQREGRHGTVAPETPPYGRLLPGVRGVRLVVLRVDAKFKYDDDKPVEHREHISGRLDERNRGRDAGAAAQQRRRRGAIGDWQAHRNRS